MKMINRIIGLLALVFAAQLTFAQSVEILPDSLNGRKVVADTLEARHALIYPAGGKLLVDSLLLKYLHTEEAIIEDLTVENLNNSVLGVDSLVVDEFAEVEDLKVRNLGSLAPAPVFSNQNKELSNAAVGFTITIPATDFFPEIVSAVSNSGSPVLGQTRVFSNGEIQGYGNNLYGLSAPLYLSLNNAHQNIYIRELELCGLDRNNTMDLFAGLYSTTVGTPGPLTTLLKMEAKSSGAAGSNSYNCWSVKTSGDDFNMDYTKHSYWVKVIPRRNTVASIDDICPGECQEEWGTVTSGANVMKLVHVKIHYDFLPSPAN
jgi:hypothetical protein